jgi:hypothetical protein
MKPLKRAILVAILAASAVVGMANINPAGAADGVPYGDNRHFSRSSLNQTPVNFYSPHDQFYGPLIANAAGDWSESASHVVSYWGTAGDSACYNGLYRNCVAVVHDSGQACGTASIYQPIIPSFGHNHIDAATIAMNLSSTCGLTLGQAQTRMCRWAGKALGVQSPAGTAAPCDNGALHPSQGDINVLTFLGGHNHPGSIHLPPGYA